MSSSTPLPSLAVEDVPIGRLRPDLAKPRRISDDELDALTPEACASSASSSPSWPDATTASWSVPRCSGRCGRSAPRRSARPPVRPAARAAGSVPGGQRGAGPWRA